MTHTYEDIVRALEEIHGLTEEYEIDAWLDSPHPLLNGMTPLRLIERGAIDEVYGVIDTDGTSVGTAS